MFPSNPLISTLILIEPININEVSCLEYLEKKKQLLLKWA